MSCRILNSLITLSTPGSLRRSSPHPYQIAASTATLTCSSIGDSIAQMGTPITVVSRRFRSTTWEPYSPCVLHNHFKRFIGCTSSTLESRCLYSSKASPTKGEKRASASPSSRFTRSSTSANSTILSTANSDKEGRVTQEGSSSTFSVPQNGASNKMSLISSHKPRGRYSSQHRAVGKTKLSVQTPRKSSEDSPVGRDRFARNERRHANRPVISVDKLNEHDVCLELRKLLSEHNTLRKSYAFQHSETAYDSFCSQCLKALSESHLLQRLCAGPAINESKKNEDAAKSADIKATKASLSGSGGAEVVLEVVTENPDSSKFSVQLPVQIMQWLCSPIILPDINCNELLHAASTSAMPSEEIGNTHGMASPYLILQERWKQHWLNMNPINFKHVFETSFALESSRQSPLICTDILAGTTETSHTSFSVVEASERTLVESEKISSIFDLLRTIVFFKWRKDEAVLASLGPKDDDAVYGNPSSHGETDKGSSEGSDLPVDFLASYIKVVRTTLLKLRALDKEMTVQTLEAAQGADTHSTDRVEERSRLIQQLQKHVQDVLEKIPKVDILLEPVFILSSSPYSSTLHAPSEGEVENSRRDCVARSNTIPTYRFHVIDLFFSLLFRYMLLQWPLLAEAHQRGALFRFGSLPWFAQDITQSMAMWYTLWETLSWMNASANSQTLLSSTKNTPPQLSRRGRQHFPSSDDIAVSFAPYCKTGYLFYVQYLRMMCSPHVLDWHSATLRHTLGLPPSFKAVLKMEDQSGLSKEVPKGKGELHVNRASLLREVALIFYSSETKQRLAYELLYLLFNCLNFVLANPCVDMGHENGEIDASIASSCRGIAAPMLFDSVSTLFIYVADMDQFISEHFYEKVLHQHEWVVFSPPPKHSPGEATESATASAVVQNLQQSLLVQSTHPYMLTRLMLQALLPSVKPWAAFPAKGMSVVWKSVLGAVATPCYHGFASGKEVMGDPMGGRDAASLENRRAAWHLAYPLLNSLSDEWLQQTLWLRLIGGLRELFLQTHHSTGAGKVLEGLGREGETGTEDAQLPGAAKSRGDNTRLKNMNQLLKLGYLGGFLLLALRKGESVAALESSQTTTPMSSSSPDEKCRAWAQTLCVEFTAATHRLISQTVEHNTDLTRYTRPLLSGWLISSPDVEAIRTFLADQDANSAATYAHLHCLLHTFVFTAELGNEVREWTRKCESLALHEAQLKDVSDPLLIHWYTVLHEDDIGLAPLKLSLLGLYRELWGLISTRQNAQNVNEKSCYEKVTSLDETVHASATPDEQEDTEINSFNRFNACELSIILRLVSTMHARLGLNSLKSLFGNFFTNLTSTIIRQVQRQHASQKQLDVDKNRGTGRSSSTKDGVSSGSTAAMLSINTSVSTIKSRLSIIERTVRNSVRNQLTQMPLSAVLDAWYLGVISGSDIEEVFCSAYPKDCNGVPGQNEENPENSLDTRHKAVEWIEDLSSLKQDLRSNKHLRLVAGLLLLREYPFYGTNISSGVPNENRKTDPKGSQAITGGDAERHRGSVKLMEIILQSLVELEYDRYVSGIGQDTRYGNPTSHSAHAAGTPHVLPTTEAETAGGVSMVEYAHQISRVHAIAAALFLQYGPNQIIRAEASYSWPSDDSLGQSSEAPPEKLPCHRRERMLVLYTLFLNALCDAIPSVERGLSDELLLYLMTSTYTIRLHYERELQYLAATHAQGGNPVDGITSDHDRFTSHFSKTAASSSVAETATPGSPPSAPVLSVLSMLQQDAGGSSSEHTSYPPGILETLSHTMKWSNYLISRLLPHVEKILTQLKQQSNAPNLRTICTSTVAFCGLEALGMPVAWWMQFPLEQLLQRAAIDRGEMQRHLDFFLMAAVNHPKASMALVHAASYLRGGCDYMSLQMLIRTLKAIILTTTTLDPEQAAQSDEVDQQHEAEPVGQGASLIPKPSVCVNYSTARYESLVKGIFYEKRIYLSFPHHLSRNHHSSPRLRSLWSSLTRCLLERHVLTAPIESFFLALHSGASVGCADTRDFEQLLAHVLFSDGVDGELPPLALMGFAEWAVMLNACASSTWNRSSYAQVLCEPLLNFVLLSTQEPFSALRGSSQYCLPRGTSQWPGAAAQDSQSSLEKKRQLCIELCHFLESVSTLCGEGDGLWEALRCLVDAWMEEIQAWKLNAVSPGSSSTAFTMGNDEIAFWIQEWTKSFNWTVKMAGHPDLVIALDNDGDIENVCIAAI